jgi:hypothetical protein
VVALPLTPAGPVRGPPALAADRAAVRTPECCPLFMSATVGSAVVHR